MGCNCRSKQPRPRFGVLVPASLRIAPGQVTGCLGAATSFKGLIYGFNTSVDAEAFVAYLRNTYEVTTQIQSLRG
jgi:hypothetical protein